MGEIAYRMPPRATARRRRMPIRRRQRDASDHDKPLRKFARIDLSRIPPGLRLDDNGRVKPLFLAPFGIGLNRIEGDVLVALGVAAVGRTVE